MQSTRNYSGTSSDSEEDKSDSMDSFDDDSKDDESEAHSTEAAPSTPKEANGNRFFSKKSTLSVNTHTGHAISSIATSGSSAALTPATAIAQFNKQLDNILKHEKFTELTDDEKKIFAGKIFCWLGSFYSVLNDLGLAEAEDEDGLKRIIDLTIKSFCYSYFLGYTEAWLKQADYLKKVSKSLPTSVEVGVGKGFEKKIQNHHSDWKAVVKDVLNENNVKLNKQFPNDCVKAINFLRGKLKTVFEDFIITEQANEILVQTRTRSLS